MDRHYFVLTWAPRILGIGMALFLGLFALDAFEPGTPVTQEIGGFLIHLLPSAAVLAIVALSWRRQWFGALAFLALAVGYAAMVMLRLDWVLVISGPLLIIGLLFFWSWRASTLKSGTPGSQKSR